MGQLAGARRVDAQQAVRLRGTHHGDGHVSDLDLFADRDRGVDLVLGRQLEEEHGAGEHDREPAAEREEQEVARLHAAAG